MVRIRLPSTGESTAIRSRHVDAQETELARPPPQT